jgi:hypothetical protein
MEEIKNSIVDQVEVTHGGRMTAMIDIPKAVGCRLLRFFVLARFQTLHIAKL